MPKKTFYIHREDLDRLFICKNLSRKEVAEYYGCSAVLIKKKCQEFGIKKSKLLENKNKERKVNINCQWCDNEFEVVRFRATNHKWMSKFCSSECSANSRYLGAGHKRAVLNANGARRRAYFNNALDISSNGDNIKEFYVRAKISKGGKHHESNLQILTQTENRRKHNKYDQKTSNKTAS
jgi:hypothetical protein